MLEWNAERSDSINFREVVVWTDRYRTRRTQENRLQARFGYYGEGKRGRERERGKKGEGYGRGRGIKKGRYARSCRLATQKRGRQDNAEKGVTLYVGQYSLSAGPE